MSDSDPESLLAAPSDLDVMKKIISTGRKRQGRKRISLTRPSSHPWAGSLEPEQGGLRFLSSVRYWLVGQNHNSQSALFNSLMGMNPRRFSLFLSFF